MDRAEIHVALEQTPLPIPYSGTETGYHYVSILKDPNAIDQIPELKGEPMMKHVIKSMHAPNAEFETVRMAHWFEDVESGKSALRCLSLGFVFRDRRGFVSFADCMMLAGNLLHYTQNDIIASDIPFLLEIQPAIFREESLTGWIMDLYVAGRGENRGAARHRLDQNLERMLPFLQTGGVAPSSSQTPS
jgi:hypothetical protein